MLSKTIFQQSLYSFMNQIQVFLFGTFSNILIVRLLSREDYGVYGLASGYFVFISWLVINPESVLVQKYAEKKKNFEQYLSQIYTFSLFKMLFLFIVSIGIAAVSFLLNKSVELAISIILFNMYQLIILFTGQIQFVLKLELKEQVISTIIFFSKIVLVALLGLLVFNNNLFVFFALLITHSLIELGMYSVSLQRVISFPFLTQLKETLLTVKNDLLSFSLWHHLSGNLIKFIYESDVVFLGLWSSYVVVGNYALAIKIANLSFIIPSLIQNAVITTLTRVRTPEKVSRAVNIFLKYSVLVSVVQIIGFIILGKFYISLHTSTYVSEIYEYALYIFLGASIVNAIRPLISYINSKTNVQRFFVFSVLPSMLFSVALYAYVAQNYGPLALAKANIVAYAFWTITLIFYTYKSGFRFSFEWLTSDERSLLAELKKKFLN